VSTGALPVGGEIGRDDRSRPGSLSTADGANGPQLPDRFLPRTSCDRRGGVDAGTCPLLRMGAEHLQPCARTRCGRPGCVHRPPHASIARDHRRTAGARRRRQSAREEKRSRPCRARHGGRKDAMAGHRGIGDRGALPDEEPSDNRDESAGNGDEGYEENELDEADREQERRAEERERAEPRSPRPDSMRCSSLLSHSVSPSRKGVFALRAPPSCSRPAASAVSSDLGTGTGLRAEILNRRFHGRKPRRRAEFPCGQLAISPGRLE